MEAREEISEIDSGCTAWQEESLTPAANMRSPFPIPGNKKGAVKKWIHISSQSLFTLLSFGSGFRVQGSRGSFAAFF